ncbi:MAG: dynamin family protein, partial [Acidimicrobiales bacterium]
MTGQVDTGGSGTPSRDRALGAVDTTTRVAAALGRQDLARELTLVRKRLEDPAFTVLVIGEFKQGKSSLINALLGTSVCPVDDDIATAVPTVLRWSETWSAAVFTDADSADADAEELRREIPLDEAQRFVSEVGNADNAERVRSVDIGLPSPLLREGLVIVDTPGVGGLASAHAVVTLNALPMADAVLFVSDASQEYSAPELEFLDTARRLCPHVFGALTKCDFYPAWRKILELDEQHLAERGLSFPILPVSSELRRAAIATRNAQLNQESGYPALEAHLRTNIVGDAERIVLHGVRTVADRATDELEQQYESERQALTDPALQEERIRALAEAEERAAALVQGAARWDSTLGDGITDLRSEATHDLDHRLRAFYPESDAAVDAIDPADARDEYEQWLYRRAAEHLAANDTLVQSRVRELVDRVESLFVEDGGAASELGFGMSIEIGTISGALSRAGEMRDTSKEKDSVATGLAALRGSYGGLMMFGILGRFVGLALVNPASLALGGLLTVRTVRELRKQSLNQRRHTTKVDGQKYIGELALVARKESADRLERIRRQLRDRYQQRAREYQESLRGAHQKAKA